MQTVHLETAMGLVLATLTEGKIMKLFRYKHFPYAIGVTFVVLSAAVAYGEDRAASKLAEAQFKSMDTDHDDRLSPAEHAAGAKRMFDVMDANKDGKVTSAEMDAAQQKISGKKRHGEKKMSSREKIKVVDTDGDGTLTAAEHEAGSRKMFDKMDGDKDGFLTREELAAGHAKLLKRQQ